MAVYLNILYVETASIHQILSNCIYCIFPARLYCGHKFCKVDPSFFKSTYSINIPVMNYLTIMLEEALHPTGTVCILKCQSRPCHILHKIRLPLLLFPQTLPCLLHVIKRTRLHYFFC